jgi:maltooligosyltrehalose trehalohydrolase
VSQARVLCGATLLFCSPYTPMLFMGEEWAAASPWRFFASFPDPELAEAVRTGRRREFAAHGWGESEVPDPMDPETVRASTLNWAELADPAHRTVYDTYRALIALRRSRPELGDPRLDRFEVEAGDGWLVLHRGVLRVAVNLSASAVSLPMTGAVPLLAANGVRVGVDTVVLPADTFAVLEV